MNKYQKRRIARIVILTLCTLLFALGAFFQKRKKQKTETSVLEAFESTEAVLLETENSKDIYVHIGGAVLEPGVYQVSEGTRVYELILMAGGFSPEADESYLNQAAILTDGQQVIIPKVGEVDENSYSTFTNSSFVNINTADKQLLMSLSGVGETKAEAIITYREKNGAFKDISEIMNVSGIGQGLFDRIKDKIKI